MKTYHGDSEITRLHDLGWAYREARVLGIANKMGVFTALAGGEMTVEQLSKSCGTKAEATEKLLIACVAMGLLEKSEGKYRNSETGQKYLVRGGELYQGDIIAHSDSVRKLWDEFENRIFIEPKPEDPAVEHRNFTMGMDNIAAGGRGRIFTDCIDLSGRKKLMDIGGGPGSYSIAACKRYPELTATVFDLPETIAIAREVIAREGMTDRVGVVEGNWDTDSFGEGNDAVLLSNVLHGPISNSDMKLGKAYDSMVAGGLLVVQEFLMNDEKTGPLIPALFNIMVGAWSQVELLDVIGKAGFKDARLVSSCEEIGCGWITAVKP